jgi:hypothetical protein
MGNISMIENFLIHLPKLSLTENEKKYFIDYFYNNHPTNNQESFRFHNWGSEVLPKETLDFTNSFFNKLGSFLKITQLKIYRLNFQIMWAGRTRQLFIHKDSISDDTFLGNNISIPIRLSWKLIGPILPLKWYRDVDEDPGDFVTNGKYGAYKPGLDFEEYEEKYKLLEAVPTYPCLINTFNWHTICQDNITDEGLRVILSAGLGRDTNYVNEEIWKEVRDKSQIFK